MGDLRQGGSRGAREDLGVSKALNQPHMTNGESENFGPISRDSRTGRPREARMYMETERRDMKAESRQPP